MEPRKEEQQQQVPEQKQEPKPKRFRLVELEERIAPSPLGAAGGNSWHAVGRGGQQKSW